MSDFIVDGTIKVYNPGEHGDKVTRVTVRDCIDCGCLVPGGPTRCKRCAAEAGAKNKTKPESGLDLIKTERQRQTSTEGYSESHDDEHDQGELADAAAWYAVQVKPAYNMIVSEDGVQFRTIWPTGWEQPSIDMPRMQQLVRAGALIAAEIDRLLRVEHE